VGCSWFAAYELIAVEGGARVLERTRRRSPSSRQADERAAERSPRASPRRAYALTLGERICGSISRR
jgi:hypothetical protein